MVDKTQINDTLRDFGLTVIGEPQLPNEGRIAKNLIVQTRERGRILVRMYPPSFDLRQVEFEVKALKFFASNGVNAPCPFELKVGSAFGGWHTFAYQLIEGRCLTQAELDRSLVSQAGHQLAKMVSVAEKFQPTGSEPHGDLEFIHGVLSRFVQSRPANADNGWLCRMFSHLQSEDLKTRLAASPRGIVHADYFFENVVENEGQVVGVIDFGDAYYGHLIMDVATGAMEFSVRENGDWDAQHLDAFLGELAPWLSAKRLTCDLFYDALLANCARFAAHTLNLSVNGGESPNVDSNPYVRRFAQLTSDLGRAMTRDAFMNALACSPR